MLETRALYEMVRVQASKRFRRRRVDTSSLSRRIRRGREAVP
jgi:hypothetical protein